jgi:GalNAc5-diNAcBac-PP-undecaprenol beta-1,3-glucosyltransferase
MKELGFTVIIATYNRADLVGRAIESVLQQDWSKLEIIVVDDCSTDNTADIIPIMYPQVKYLRQEFNQGPGPARNRGLREALQPWALIIDDDDALMPGSLQAIADRMKSFPEFDVYPVLNFAHDNGKLSKPFLVVRVTDYFRGDIEGDFVPVIQVQLFLKEGFAYPSLHIGGEHLLWWDIAENYGIPSWAEPVAHVHVDAPSRLTSFQGQLHRAREYAKLQDLTLKRFNGLMNRYSPETATSKWLGAATYWLLAGERRICRERLRKANKGKFTPYLGVVWLLSWLPLQVTRILFLRYRERNVRSS